MIDKTINIKQTIDHHHLQRLEAEAVYIIREVVAQADKPALLFSGGKDSALLLHLAIKAFKCGNRKLQLPFPLVHIDTGHNYPEVIAFRDEVVNKLGAQLIIGSVEESIKKGTVKLHKATDSRNASQSVTLLETIYEHDLSALMGGARRDEEKARAKERVFSFRDEFGGWDPKAQRPELWDLFNAGINNGEHIRAFPISNWTELDVWQYIAIESIALPSIYFAHKREVVERKGLCMPITEITPKLEGEISEIKSVRFRTVGDISCTCPVLSDADNVEKIIFETALANLSERGETRMDDQTNETSMEMRKKEGYF